MARPQDTSQVNQPYDQSVAKSYKFMIRKLLDAVRGSLHVLLGQYQLMGICLLALSVFPDMIWNSLFNKVNLHPDHWTSFLDWFKHIDDKILMGERFFSNAKVYSMLCQLSGKI